VIDRAGIRGGFDVEVLDRRKCPLPIFAQHLGFIGDFNEPTYSAASVRDWNRKIKQADAYLAITPEYNPSVPGVLKNALDSGTAPHRLSNQSSGGGRRRSRGRSGMTAPHQTLDGDDRNYYRSIRPELVVPTPRLSERASPRQRPIGAARHCGGRRSGFARRALQCLPTASKSWSPGQ
jgi:hypothetical protein